MKGLFSLISGFIFGIGLIISGMANPAKVLAFLDITGLWDPSLVFVMMGGIFIGAFAFRYAKRVNKTIFSEPISCPTSNKITPSLIIGSLIFGIGWGLVGFCPGPAILAAGCLNIKAIGFCVAMLVGMFIFTILPKQL